MMNIAKSLASLSKSKQNQTYPVMNELNYFMLKQTTAISMYVGVYLYVLPNSTESVKTIEYIDIYAEPLKQ